MLPFFDYSIANTSHVVNTYFEIFFTQLFIFMLYICVKEKGKGFCSPA